MINFLNACENPAILKIIAFADRIMDIIFLIVPIGLILMISIDLVKNVIAGKEDDMKKNFNLAIKRIIYAVALFLVPTVISLVVSIISDIENNFDKQYSTCFQNIKYITYYEKMYDKRLKEEDERYKEYLEQIHADDRFKNAAAVYQILKNNGTSSETVVGQKYTDLTEKELRDLTAVAYSEQNVAGIEAMKAEATVMANLTERDGYSSVYEYVTHGSGWFGCVYDGGSYCNYDGSVQKKIADNSKYVTDEMVDAIKEVLVNGNRNMPLYIDEHDCWDCYGTCSNGNKGDICEISVNGSTYTNMSDIKNWSNYKKDETVMKNIYGSTWTFYTYFPGATDSNGDDSDPFGYTAAYRAKFN